jgi:hypothetical protein
MGRWSNSPGREATAECGYLMESESEAEAIRLDVKADDRDAEKQALWVGFKPRRKLRADCRGLRRLSLEGQAPRWGGIPPGKRLKRI